MVEHAVLFRVGGGSCVTKDCPRHSRTFDDRHWLFTGDPSKLSLAARKVFRYFQS